MTMTLEMEIMSWESTDKPGPGVKGWCENAGWWCCGDW